MDINTRVILNATVLTTEIDDEIGMMNMEQGFYYTLNSVGKRIWGLLENEVAVADIVATLMKEYNVDFSVCQKDVIEILELLEQNKLIEVANNI